jgi:predicted esterase
MERGVRRALVAAWAVFCALGAAACNPMPGERDATARHPNDTAAPATGISAIERSAPPSMNAATDPLRGPSTEPAEPPLPPMPARAEQLRDGDVRVDLYPPLDASLKRAPLVVFLHGAGDTPRSCGWIQAAGRTKSFLACPAGNLAYDEDAFDWAGPTQDRIATVDAALAAVDAALGARVDHAGGDVLVGSSRGAYLARDFLATHAGVFRGVVYLGAEIKPDPVGLKKAGIRRVVLACGDYDGAARQMKSTAAALDAQGVPARFMSFGKMGHGWPRDIDAVLTRAIEWIREDPGFGS